MRVALRQDDERMALAQGLVVGPALWGVITNFVLYVVPGMAGAAVGWAITLTVGAVVVWRAPRPLCPRLRTVAGFTVATLALFWVALATRQLIGVLDPHTDLGLGGSIRAGGFPPEPFWNPGMPAPYHHGAPLLTGLLMPPFGPDLAFVTELLGAYGWTSLVLVATTALLQRGSPVSLVVAAPLLLSPGIWTVLAVGPGVLQIPIPAGLPEGGLRESLADIYWPAVELAPKVLRTELLPDIWKPAFTLGYALAFVVLERTAGDNRRSWPAAMTLAGLVGFVGVLTTTLAPVVFVMWVGLEALRLVESRRERLALAQGAGRTRGWLQLGAAPGGVGGDLVRAGAGVALAALLIGGGGGLFTELLDSSPSTGLTLATSLHSQDLALLGSIDRRPGGIAMLGVGAVAVAGAAVLLARRDRLVLALAAGAVLLALAWLAFIYPPFPGDLNRLGGHARNLALMALLLALSARLSDLASVRWRFAAGALLLGLIAWPTVVVPIRSAGLAVGNGIQLANANAAYDEPREPDAPAVVRRYRLSPMSERLAAYLRANTPLEARVLATTPPFMNVVFATGRPNAAGLAGRLHLIYFIGPEYLDALDFLEPAAFRRLGLEYVHATDEWRAGLPDGAVRRLDNPRWFELLASDGGEALYRVRPAFLELEAAPHPASFEALRSLPPSVTVYLSHNPWWTWLRVTSVLPQARLLGSNHIRFLHLRTPPWPVEPIGEQAPDVVVLPARVDPWMLPDGWRPIWRNNDAAIYASPWTETPNMALPEPAPPPVSVRVTNARLDQGRLTFTATYGERAPERWTSQDWLLVPLLESPLGIPVGFMHHERGPAFTKWFDGLLSSGSAATTHTYRLDLSTAALEVRNDLGAFTPLPASADDVGPGTWALVIRLRHEWQPNHWRDTAFIPVARFRVAGDGEVAFEIYDHARGG